MLTLFKRGLKSVTVLAYYMGTKKLIHSDFIVPGVKEKAG